MSKITIAFDVDGTLRANSEERHRTEVEPNPRQVELLKALAHSKNVEIHLWSNRGAEYCQEMRKALGLEKYIKESHCHKKAWYKQDDDEIDFRLPDIAFDDQQIFDGGVNNIIVREK